MGINNSDDSIEENNQLTLDTKEAKKQENNDSIRHDEIKDNQTSKLDQIKIDQDNADILSKKIKNGEVEENIEKKQLGITELLNNIEVKERHKILDSIYLGYDGTENGITKFEITREKQVDEGMNIDGSLIGEIEIDGEKITFQKGLYYFEDHYERRKTNQEFIAHILKEIDETYDPSIVLQVMSGFKNIFMKIAA